MPSTSVSSGRVRGSTTTSDLSFVRLTKTTCPMCEHAAKWPRRYAQRKRILLLFTSATTFIPALLRRGLTAARPVRTESIGDRRPRAARAPLGFRILRHAEVDRPTMSIRKRNSPPERRPVTRALFPLPKR